MVAPDSATVSELNGRARADRVASGLVAEAGLTVADGQLAGVGDEVVTRENNRLLVHRPALGEKRRPLGGPSDKCRREHGRAPPGRPGRGGPAG